MTISLIFLALGVLLLIAAIALIVLAGSTGRGRAAWARENGWEFRREDPDLAREWSNYWGTNGAAASNVLSGRIDGRSAHLARMGDTSVAVIRRTGNSDVVLRLYPAAQQDHSHAVGNDASNSRPSTAPGTVATLGGWDIVGDHALIPALDFRFETGISQLRLLGTALVVDPWWVILRTEGDLPIARVPEVFNALALIDDACRTLPSATAEVIDFSQLDPTRAFGRDKVSIGGGPRIQAVADPDPTPDSESAAKAASTVDSAAVLKPLSSVAEQSSNEQSAESLSQPADLKSWDMPDAESAAKDTAQPDWNSRPHTPRQSVTLPRRDQGTLVGDEEPLSIADMDQDLPAVGEDPDHQRTHYRPGRVVRVQSEQYPALFGHSQQNQGRHRRPAAKHAPKEKTHPETAEIIAVQFQQEITDAKPQTIDPANIIDTTEQLDNEDRN